MKGFYIEITNNLLEPKHRKKMGTAVWEFMWCLDKITKIDENQMGWVYGGRPIQLKEIKEEIGITEPKISKNLNKLAKEGYLILLRTPHGLIIKVCKAKKRFAQKGKSDLPKRENQICPKGKIRFAQKGKSNIRQDTIDKTYNNILITNASQSDADSTGRIINELIGKFKLINPTYERLFANKTQRTCLERLLKKMGREKLEQVLDILPKIYGRPYSPTIATPFQLETKLADLFAYLKKEQQKGPKLIEI